MDACYRHKLALITQNWVKCSSRVAVDGELEGGGEGGKKIEISAEKVFQTG